MSAAEPHAEVTIYTPLVPPFRHQLSGETVTVGRASDCTIPIKDRYLSRKHVEISCIRGTWQLRDCGSANGTFVNGNRVERECSLAGGDRIRIGDTELLFESAEHNTDRILAIGDAAVRTTIAIPVHDLEHVRYDTADVSKIHTLNRLAAELLEDRPLDQLFGYITERVLRHTEASRAAIGLLRPDGTSFLNVEVRRQDRDDTTELRISRTVLDEVVKEKKALASIDVSIDEKLKHAQSLVMQGVRSIVCAPLIIGDSVAGVLYLDYLGHQRQISEDDVRLVAQIARFAAIKLETTRLREEAIQKRIMDEELKTASVIQRRLLPPAPTGIAGFTFAGMNRPCRTVSGDYYDFVVRPNGHIYFVIADVSGKGVTAGLMMAGLQAAFRIFSKADPQPAQMMLSLNSALKEILPQSKFVTMFLGRLDTRDGTVEYANGGHTPPLWVRSQAIEELGETDPLLGVITSAEYVNRTILLERGDALVLFTDGLSEAENREGEELSAPLLQQKLAGAHGSVAEKIAHTVEETVLAHTGDRPLADDVTLVVVSRNEGSVENDRLDQTLRT